MWDVRHVAGRLKAKRGRQVIQDYGAGVSFLSTCYSCTVVFCVKRRVQPHLSAPNSPLAPINGAPWTGIDDQIMSSCCLVNATVSLFVFFRRFSPGSLSVKLPFPLTQSFSVNTVPQTVNEIYSHLKKKKKKSPIDNKRRTNQEVEAATSTTKRVMLKTL